MKSILAGLTLTLWILWFPAYTQTDSVYCLPISKARSLVADALRRRVADSLNHSLSTRVELLETHQADQYNSFTNLLNNQKEKDIYFREITDHLNSLVASYKSEAKENRWQATKFKILAILEAVGMVVLVIVLI
jgi:hypothetical protein